MGLLSSLIFTGAVFLPNFSILGLSPLTGLMLLALSLWTVHLALYPNRQIFSQALLIPLLPGLFFMVLLTGCLILNSAMRGPEWRYLIDWLLGIIWIPLLFLSLSSRGFIRIETIRRTVLLLSFLMAITLALMFMLLGNLFFLRGEIDFPIISATVLGNPNRVARTALALLALNQFFLWRAVDGLYSKRPHRLAQLLLILVISMSLSRAGVAALLLFLILINFRADGGTAIASMMRVAATVIIASVALAALVTFSEPARERVAEIFEITSSVQSGTAKGARAKTWLASGIIVRNQPLLGVGAEETTRHLAENGSLKTKYLANGRSERIVIAVHGGFLEIQVYGGVISLIGLVTLFVALLAWSARASRSATSRSRRDAATLLFIYLAVLVMLNIAAGNLRDPFTWMVLGVLFTLSVHDFDVFRRDNHQSVPDRRSPAAPIELT